MPQEELAERAGLSVQGLSALENGRRQVPYRHTVTRLARALGLSDIETTALEAAVVRVRDAAPAGVPASGGHSKAIRPDGGGGGDASPPARSPQPLRTDLPTQFTGFIRREREQGEERAPVQGAPQYPDGVWLVQLTPLADAAVAVQAVAQETGLREAPNRPLLTTLVDHLDERQLLLVLDECEHLNASHEIMRQ
jgi:transcriptional regulator with XRE-family HTH domain